MKLYYAETVMPRLACAVAQYVGAPVEYIFLDLTAGEHRRPSYRMLNPQGNVPFFVEGPVTLWEADAICCYLASEFAPELWPAHKVHEIVQWLSWNARCFTHAGAALYFENSVKPQLLHGCPDQSVVERSARSFREYSSLLENHLRSKNFVLGRELTYCDFSIATMLPYAAAAQLPLDEFPHIQNWYHQVASLHAWQHPFPQ
ncbi:glutathione S-transferase family protein [Bradyrhizobium guangzhouense]|uniref:Glutathione S-transferase family protein n=1 Tax=Bradyrhizobium guangzhouense TaxID=1325095 RepID=A0AAE6C6E0_9BRAD|nr:glutathione S-transferase family protein [Bradyrhizobium guangzhouense]QAU44351.1 glutathione S-transferase family protein [Bradyrhizobium guangzhouense]RXH09344.1 glutathione S-transferase family protein [Bradyrhizobium guangzhouense]RXH10079.1 glutathione S-transferase family protein [Bradyrhizobium guangzhouense]